jgi:hypothetical protein
MTNNTRQLLRSKVEVFSHEGGDFFELLVSLEGQTLGHYRVLNLFEVGGQGILYSVQHPDYPNVPLLLKLPFIEHHRPAYLSERIFRRRRYTICHEAFILKRFQLPAFPQCKDFFWATNPLIDSWWGSVVSKKDPCLIMEHLTGELLDDALAKLHQQKRFKQIYRIACQAATTFLNLSLQILKSEEHGFLYTDLRPGNLFNHIGNDGKQSIRVIDAGSVTPIWIRLGTPWPYHLAYVPPDFYDWLSRGELEDGKKIPPPWPSFVLYTLGKTLHQIITAKEPLPRSDPEWDTATLKIYPPEMVEVLV